MKACQGKKRVRQIAVDIFGRAKYCRVLFNAEAYFEKAEIEHSAVVDESDHTQDWNEEKQRIQCPVHGTREASGKCADIIGKRWRHMPHTPCKSRDQRKPQQKTDQRMYIDPKCLRRLRPIIMQQTEHAHDNYQKKHCPVESNGARSIADVALERPGSF